MNTDHTSSIKREIKAGDYSRYGRLVASVQSGFAMEHDQLIGEMTQIER